MLLLRMEKHASEVFYANVDTYGEVFRVYCSRPRGIYMDFVLFVVLCARHYPQDELSVVHI